MPMFDQTTGCAACSLQATKQLWSPQDRRAYRLCDRHAELAATQRHMIEVGTDVPWPENDGDWRQSVSADAIEEIEKTFAMLRQTHPEWGIEGRFRHGWPDEDESPRFDSVDVIVYARLADGRTWRNGGKLVLEPYRHNLEHVAVMIGLFEGGIARHNAKDPDDGR